MSAARMVAAKAFDRNEKGDKATDYFSVRDSMDLH